jgi:glycosyltransferase involved in cell wall biosynthesis
MVVIDDASQDNTAEIIQAFNDKRIRYIRHDTNKREAGARNSGVQNSQGEYIAFLDDDDEWLPEKLQKQVDLLDNSPPVVGAVYTGFLKIDRLTGEMLDQIVPTKRGNIFQEMFIQNWVGTPSTLLLRKECFETVGLFDENIVFGTDRDMWLRISKVFLFEYIREPLVKYSVHENKLSNDHELMIMGMESFNRKYQAFFARDRKNFSDRFHRLGVFYCLIGETNKGRKALLQAIRLYPFDVRYYFRLFLSLFGAKNFKKGTEIRERLAAGAKTMQSLGSKSIAKHQIHR